MKKIFLLLAALLCAVAAQAEPSSKPGDKNVFSVTADAEIRVKPDRVHLTLGVNERSKDLRGAKDRMSDTLKKAIAFCKSKGIQDKHIQTSYISIHPDYRYDDDKMRIVMRHFSLASNFTITLENPELYETILYTLLDMGINNVENVSFTTSELRKYRDEARIAAVKAAREKAALFADAAGVKLGKVINIQEGRPISVVRGMQRNYSQNFSQNSLAEAPNVDAAEGFALGMVPVKAEVTLVYELE
ncbi:MAG: SIMPL domain-containing protein [Deltaproteobacteria bacterium]|nr:SIMPL domain-containing protein [Deltaproteobacteria bacterium]